MAARVKLIGVDSTGFEIDAASSDAVRWLVRDRRHRTREYGSLDYAKEAFETFRALGGVLLDEAEPQPLEAKGRVSSAEIEALFGFIIEDLEEDAAAATASRLASRFQYDAAEIAAIGRVGDMHIQSGETGLDVFLSYPVGEPVLTIPRGLAPHVARLMIDAWERGCGHGIEIGVERVKIAVDRVSKKAPVA